MMENLSWLFYAYGAGWLLIFAYLFWIGRREQQLRRKVAELTELLNEKWTRK
jgi:CcmD family protein